MPRHPAVAPSVAAMPGSIYSSLAHRLGQRAGETFPLHVGDTWLPPAQGCRMEDLRVAEQPGLHNYAPIAGLPSLIDAIVERQRAKVGAPTERRDVLVAAGATGALGAVVGALVAPGDEVLILAPYWPLIAGIVRSFHATPVPVPSFVPDVPAARGAQAAPRRAPDAATVVGAARARLTERTCALYLSTPNNPTGQLLAPAVVEALVAFAREHDLWVLADEVYEDYLYAATPHRYARGLAPERTFSVHSASKAWGMAGNRCGWVVGPGEAMDHVRKVSTHTFYSTPTAAQLAAARAFAGPGDAWVATAKAQYRALGVEAARRLGVPAPDGSTFLFLDVKDRLDGRGLGGLLDDCVERGLLVAPGPSFGPYPTHVRVCFTSAPPDVVLRGVDVLANVLGR